MSTDILTPFLNRAGEFDPAGWFQLVPKGTFPIKRKEGDKTVIYEQVVDDTAVQRIVAAFTNRQAADPTYRFLIDFEHFSHDTEKSSEAAAWGNRMEARADGVWATAEWSDAGEAAIKSKRYRYLSPVWLPNQVERLGPRSVRPVAVNDAGLTNKPNLGESLVPFWNRASDESLSGLSATEKHSTETHTVMKDQLIVHFGMPATASDADVIAKAVAFLNRAKEADGLQVRIDALNTEHTAYKNRHESLLKVSVDRTMEEYKGVITAEAEPIYRNRLTSDYEGTLAMLKGIKPAVVTAKGPVHQSGKGSAASAEKKIAGGEGDEGQPFMNRVKELRLADSKLTDGQAMVRAAQDDPELYEQYRQSLTPAE